MWERPSGIGRKDAGTYEGSTYVRTNLVQKTDLFGSNKNTEGARDQYFADCISISSSSNGGKRTIPGHVWVCSDLQNLTRSPLDSLHKPEELSYQ